MTDYRIGMLWMEGPLSFLEQLCIASFRDAGHQVVLYRYGEVSGIPEGIEVASAETILPRANFLQHERTGSPALHSDLFRYHMLRDNHDMIWADTDAYCVRKFETETGHFHGWESEKHVNGGVLGLAPGSATLQALLEFTSNEFAIPPWYDEETKAAYADKRDRGEPVHAGEMPWGVWGPHAVTHFLQATGEIKHAFPRHVLYPVTFKDRRFMTKPDFDLSDHIRPDTLSIHFYGRRMRRRLEEKFNSQPPPRSLISKLLDKHGIDPSLAPIPQKHKVQPGTSAPVASLVVVPAPANPSTVTAPAVATHAGLPDASINLTALADRYGSDKGSKKHRYTELYNLLFLPYRDRQINFLEMGLQIGGPEHGKGADRQTSDAPSVRMWLEYFPHAMVYGLDVSDFSWFQHERFKFVRCDMDNRQNIRLQGDSLPPIDIAIDDASHASHHQQFGFLELFPKLRSGGLYVIEDLRWQPEPYERPGITKTAALFQSWLDKREFAHSDPDIAADFNALRPQISGAFLFQAHFRKSKRDQLVVIQKR
jgi:hypothetical protein